MNGRDPDFFQEVMDMSCNSSGMCVFGNNSWWIIILILLLVCGNNGIFNTGCCENNCGC